MDTYAARTPTIRTSRILIGVIVIAFVGALALGVAFATRAISFDSLTTSASQASLIRLQGAVPGYPPHYGLAGPSRVSPNAQSWTGYPPHYGLAGPSRVSPNAQSWTGYPPHYGLAGPSGVVRGVYPMGGAPVPGGLAGPSGVESSH